MSNMSDGGPPPAWQAALTQKQDWDAYKRGFFAQYGKYPLGSKNLGQFTAKYAAKMERQARRDATGQGYRDWTQSGWGKKTDPNKTQFSDGEILGRGRYRRKRRYRRKARGRGSYNFARSMNNIGSGISNFGKRLTTRKQRTGMANFAGGIASTAIRKYAGQGMYTAGSGSYHTLGNTTSTNALIKGSSMSVPSFTSMTDEQGDVIVSHTEYVRDIYGNPDDDHFVNFGLGINPGLEATFPWLSQLAANFDEYVMIQCMFTYRSTMTSVISSTAGQVGNVVMVTDYNPDKAIFDDKMRMMQYDGSQSGKITKDALHGVECDPRKLSGSEGKRVRTKPVLKDGDKMDYDLGTFQLAISNTPGVVANATIGELWVSYKVLLRKPKFYSTLGLAISRSDYTSSDDVTANNDDATLKYDLWGKGWNGVEGYPLCGEQNSIAFHVQSILGTGLDKSTNPTLFPALLWPVASTGQPLTTVPTVIPGGTGNNCATIVIFPGHVAGKYELILSQEGTLGANGVGTLLNNVAYTGGNVNPIFDLHQGGLAQTDNASFFKCADMTSGGDAQATGQQTGGYISSNVSRITIIHVNVEVASNGKDNYIVLLTPLHGGVQFDRNELRIQEYNSYDSFSAPNFVNSQGVVIQTATAGTGYAGSASSDSAHSRRLTLS